MKRLDLNIKLFAAASAMVLLGACSGLAPERRVELKIAPQWEAPLPHAGSLTTLGRWWQEQGDPLLVELIQAAQDVSPTVSSALYKVEAARSQQVAANALLLPTLNAQTSVRRGVALPGASQATRTDASVLASWELDVTGANRAANRAAAGRLEGSQAQWHDARVSVAAEVAKLYYSIQSCQQQTRLALADEKSTSQTARITELSMQAGFANSAASATARASAAEASSRLRLQKAQCDLYVKAMVSLTAIDETVLRKKLDGQEQTEQLKAVFPVPAVPVRAISQRPDVFSAERDVIYAAAQIGTAMAARYPRLSLDGSITGLRLEDRGASQEYSLWSFGPLTLNLPIFDGGQRKAAVKSAEAAYRDAVVNYQSKVRLAVREVEEALVSLNASETRMADLQAAAEGYAQALSVTQARYGQGLASLLELEDARRSSLGAESALLSLKLERRQAWVTLYRAVGGGYDAPTALALAPSQP